MTSSTFPPELSPRSRGSSSPVCVIPVRGGSSRFPRKWSAELAGKPLLWHTIACAASTRLFDPRNIYVNTDDKEIAWLALRGGAQVYMRPLELGADTVQAGRVIAEQAETCRWHADTPVCVMLSTAPLTKPEDIVVSKALLSEKSPVVHAVTRLEHPIERALRLDSRGQLSWAGGDPAVGDRGTQSFPLAFRITGGFTWVLAGHLTSTGSYWHEQMRGYEVARETAVDIDGPEDLVLAEALLRTR